MDYLLQISNLRCDGHPPRRVYSEASVSNLWRNGKTESGINIHQFSWFLGSQIVVNS
jgi:hypothetical protein